MNTLLLISNIILWFLVVGLAFVVYALTRQIGVLYERVAPAGALSVNKKLEPGQTAPALTLQTLDNKLVDIGGGRSSSRSQLLFFASPDCPVCKTLLPTLVSANRHESDWLDIVLASDGDDLNHKAFIKDFGLDQFPYVVSELLGKSYGVAKLPYAVLIDEQGTIASMGIVNSREHLDSLFEAKDRQVSSIQDYLSASQAQQ
jgi:methylamine dehydrogenase accessory protein MauD